MREGISLQTRRELLQHLLPQYRGASTVKKKSKLLDAFTAAMGYNRKYAMGLLNHARVEQSTFSAHGHTITGQKSNMPCS